MLFCNEEFSCFFILSLGDLPVCQTYTIGNQTDWSSKERIKEHKKSLLGNNIHSSYAHQLRNWRHHFDFNFGILHSENKSLLLTLLGCVESGRFHFEGALSNVQLDVNRSSFLNLFPWRRWDFRQYLSVNCNFY